LFRSPTSGVSVLSDGVAKGRQTMQPLSLPLVKPDVRHYRIRLTDDRSAIGIHNDLRVMTKQVSTTLAPLLGLTAQFPSQKRGFQDQRYPFFRRGHYVQAVLPLLMKTRSKSCPLAPRGLAASTLLWAGPTPGRNGKAGYGFPASLGLGLPAALPVPPGLPGSLTILWIRAASNHPGRPGATLLLSHGAGGRLPHKLGGSPPPRFILTRPNRVRLRCGLHPVPVLTTLTGSLDTSGYPWCRTVTSW
jgi:hypothetical protein